MMRPHNAARNEVKKYHYSELDLDSVIFSVLVSKVWPESIKNVKQVAITDGSFRVVTINSDCRTFLLYFIFT